MKACRQRPLSLLYIYTEPINKDILLRAFANLQIKFTRAHTSMEMFKRKMFYLVKGNAFRMAQHNMNNEPHNQSKLARLYIRDRVYTYAPICIRFTQKMWQGLNIRICSFFHLVITRMLLRC